MASKQLENRPALRRKARPTAEPAARTSRRAAPLSAGAGNGSDQNEKDGGKGAPSMPLGSSAGSSSPLEGSSAATPVDGAAACGAPLILAELARRLLLDELAPTAVLIDAAQQIVYRFGRTSRYLELPNGKPTRDFFTLIRDGLRSEVRAAVQQAIRQGRRVIVGPVHVRQPEGYALVRASVLPVRAPREATGSLLIVFEDLPESAPAGAPRGGDSMLRELERELEATRDDLHAMIEALKASNEALRASNDEVSAMNEELKSGNEELQGWREELQSVNIQLQENVRELEGANNDIANFLNCTDIPTVILDRGFCIKRFTPAATRLFRLVPGDVGRLLSDIAPLFADADFLRDAADVLADLAPRQATLPTESGCWCLRRVMPYRTADDRIEGVIATFTDVTTLKQVQDDLRKLNEQLEERVRQRVAELHAANAALEQKNAEQEQTELSLRESRERMRALVDSAADAVITFDELGTIESVNPAAERMFQFAPEEMVGRPVKTFVPALERTGERQEFGRRAKNGAPRRGATRREMQGRRRDGSRFPLELAVGEISPLRLFTGIVHDISRRKELERDVAEVSSLEQRRIAQDLHDSVGQDLTALRMMAKDLAETLSADGSERAELAERISHGLQRALQEVRDVTQGLSPVPVDAHGLMSALSDLVDRAQNQSHVACRFECPAPVLLDDNVSATQLYRIAQEAVANALKHAEPTQVVVTLRVEGDTLVLRVEDDGAGIAEKPRDDRGFGLRIMHNRAAVIGATLSVLPGQRGGTVVTCLMPRRKQNGQKQKKGKPPRKSPDRRRPSRRP